MIVYALGTSDDAILLLPEKTITFGSIKVDQVKKDTLFIVNIGCDTLRIDSLHSSFPALFRIDNKPYPINLLPGKNIGIGIEFTPKSEGDFLESAALWTNLGRTFITLTGTGYKDPVISVSEDKKIPYFIYPNPTRGILHATLARESSYAIINVIGNIVQTGNLFTGDNQLDISVLPNGVYTMIANGTTRKVIVNK
jgi:hypothetical protein